jgi:hypothetical protein
MIDECMVDEYMIDEYMIDECIVYNSFLPFSLIWKKKEEELVMIIM